MKSTVLLEEPSPHRNAVSIVASDGRSVHLYLNLGPELGVRARWVRNLIAAPERPEVERMRQGGAPMLPAPFCAHPRGAGAPDPRLLRLTWSETGDAVALSDGGDLLAVIPPWGGQMPGYARDCTAESDLCWPLGTPEDNAIFGRVAAAEEYWAWWRARPWAATRDATCAAASAALGEPRHYYVIDGGNWPPKALLRHRFQGAEVLTTIGVSLRAQPAAEMAVQDPSRVHRIELAIAIDASLASEAAVRGLGECVSELSGLPWSRCTWLGDGHTIPCDAVPRGGASRTGFVAVLLLKDPPGGAPPLRHSPVRGDPVNVLWMVPITASERDHAIAHGGASLVERLRAAGVTWIHRDRQSVA